MITLPELKRLLEYDPKTGYWTRIVAMGPSAAGTHPGYKTNDGYIQMMVLGVKYLSHRLAWFYMTGEWPKEQVDHKNGTRDDNRWLNLREASSSQNNQNRKQRNKNGFKGIKKTKSNTYLARISFRGKVHCLGTFKTPEAAHAAYLNAASKYYGEYANGTTSC